jgi:hypothetical protein
MQFLSSIAPADLWTLLWNELTRYGCQVQSKPRNRVKHAVSRVNSCGANSAWELHIKISVHVIYRCEKLRKIFRYDFQGPVVAIKHFSCNLNNYMHVWSLLERKVAPPYQNAQCSVNANSETQASGLGRFALETQIWNFTFQDSSLMISLFQLVNVNFPENCNARMYNNRGHSWCVLSYG